MRIIVEKSFPEDLESRVSVITNAVNTGLKTVTLLHLDDKAVEAKEVRARIRETRGKGYLPVYQTLEHYCDTFYNIALLARETIVRHTDKTSYVGYSLTNAGKTYGLPIAAFTLKYAVDNNMSMFSVLGSTVSHGETRSPYNRIKILEELYEEISRKKDLQEKCEIDHSSISKHLISLQKTGLVKFSSIGAIHKGKCKYRWKEGRKLEDVKPVRGYRSLSYGVAKHLAANPHKGFDYSFLANLLGCRYASTISFILYGLKEQDLIEREQWGGRVYSEASLSDKGKEFVDSWINPVKEALCDGGSLYKMRGILNEFRTNPELLLDYVTKKIELYRQVSPNINKKSSEERINEIKKVLIGSPKRTSKEISEILKVSQITISQYLRFIPGIKEEKQETEVRYFLEE